MSDLEARDVQVGRNFRKLRGDVNQQTVADAMRDRGFRWSQATVWAVEKGDRPLRLTEAEALADVLGRPLSLLTASEAAADLVMLYSSARRAHEQIRAATREFLEARAIIRETLDAASSAGEPLPVPLADGGGWLEETPDTAVRQGVADFERA